MTSSSDVLRSALSKLKLSSDDCPWLLLSMDHADDTNPEQETSPETLEFLNLQLGCCLERLLPFFLGKYGCADLPEPMLEISLHAPVYTCEQAKQLCPRAQKAGGRAPLDMKNLFLRDKKKNFFLVSAAVDTEIKLKELKFAKQVGFASSDALQEKLKLLPGSVTPFGLLNDTSSEVQFHLDPRVVAPDEDGSCPTVSFHPNACHATVYMKATDFVEFVEKETSHEVNILELG